MDRSTLSQPVSEIMTAPVRTVEYDTSVTDAARMLSYDDIGSLVVESGGVDGILTESDLVQTVAAEHDVTRMTVGQLMTGTVLTIDADSSVETACERMRANGVKKLPVVEDGELVGIVTTTDVTHSLVPDLDEVITSHQ
jgi:CBS domain-containing protein